MLKWELAQNMSRPMSDTTKVEMNYAICAPRMYKGRIESLVSKCIGFADMIQLTHLKLQQVMSKMVPDGVYLDMDGLAEVDLGNGTNYLSLIHISEPTRLRRNRVFRNHH